MDENRPTIKSIVTDWHGKSVRECFGARGGKYLAIPTSEIIENLFVLLKTLFEYGYTFKEINDDRINTMITNICWDEDTISGMSSLDIRKAKKKLSKKWEVVLSKYSDIKLATLDGSEKIAAVQKLEPKPQTTPDMNTNDRIVMDTSDLNEALIDPEILAELAAIGKVLRAD